MTDVRRAMEALQRSDMAPHITSWRIIAPCSPRYADPPEALDPRLLAMLRSQGVEQLYTHQVGAVRAALAGENIVVVTPTASGKTLCYNLPVLQALLDAPESCALYLFPTKALAHDQLHALSASRDALTLDAAIATYDGDTPSNRRVEIRRQARVVLTNPDMLHVGLLPYHARWQRFFRNLRYVVLDEMHHYRGIFGSHVANVIRRLERICRFYGSRPQYIGCSATIANPVQLAEKLTGQPTTVVADNGAPSGAKSFLFYNPPIINQQMGLRRPTLNEARLLANHFLDRGVQTIVFARSRLAVELLLVALRNDAHLSERDPNCLKGYRGGYLAAERRRIEVGLRNGGIRGVVATNALELGVDIGGLAVCIMAGYPGAVASMWQQAGRAGRGCDESAAILVASPSPLDQYMVTHPDYFFGQSPERALINPDNLYVLLSHIKCAVYELPFAQDERYGCEDVHEILRYLAEAGQVRQAKDVWYWAGQGEPAQEVSLRTADPNRVTIVGCDAGVSSGQKDYPAPTRSVLGYLDRASVPALLHEGAIYWHDGQQYWVEALDWDGGLAQVRPVSVDYYTEATRSSNIHIERVIETHQRGAAQLAYGEVTFTSRVTGYRRMRLGGSEHLGWGDVNLPEQQMLTAACWVMLPQELVDQLLEEGWWVGEYVGSRGPNWPHQRDLARRRDHFRCRWCGAAERPDRQHDVHHLIPFREFGWVAGENENYRRANQLDNLITLCPSCHRRAEQSVAAQSTLSSLGRVLGHLLPLYLMCDPHDVGIHAEVRATQTGLPTLFMYDNVPGGAGLSERLPELFLELLAKSAELVRDCPCAAGCPSCVGPVEQGNDLVKQQVLRLISRIQDLSAE